MRLSYQKRKAVQAVLILLGYGSPSLVADGIFGPETEAALKAYQTKYGIKVSGKVCKGTAEMLECEDVLLQENPCIKHQQCMLILLGFGGQALVANGESNVTTMNAQRALVNAGMTRTRETRLNFLGG